MVEILSDAVRVTARLAPEGASQREFGIALYLHRVDTLQDDRADASFIRDVRQYATAAAVSADNAPDEVVEAARIYFQQSPFPRNLQTGTVIAAVQPSYIFGAGQRSVTAIEALGNGVALSLNGNDFTGELRHPDFSRRHCHGAPDRNSLGRRAGFPAHRHREPGDRHHRRAGR